MDGLNLAEDLPLSARQAGSPSSGSTKPTRPKMRRRHQGLDAHRNPAEDAPFPASSPSCLPAWTAAFYAPPRIGEASQARRLTVAVPHAACRSIKSHSSLFRSTPALAAPTRSMRYTLG
ncbi:hypothetical protein PaG_06361 [Moesziomyces aphidis]|uniref:Uncharacterized protein n=1 Tax=Moesziomyces aphidis TaxID=84754 RepID=W3VD35_MOEAP|nr:hypothetical protein PaG_06361 [Moesziomyces aphidis]